MMHLTIAIIMIVLSSSLKQSQPETIQPNNLLSTLTVNETLKNGNITVLSSTVNPNVYISAHSDDCTVIDKMCGTINGFVINNQTMKRYRNDIQWEVNTQDNKIFCFNLINTTTYLYLDGEDCQKVTNLPKQCGQIKLYNTNNKECNNKYGWFIDNVNNNLALKSVQYNDTYIFFNTEKCQSTDMFACGSLSGLRRDNTTITLDTKYIYLNMEIISTKLVTRTP